MTEAEWETCEDPRKLLGFAHGDVRDRRHRLFASACCRRKWKYISDKRIYQAIETAERFAEGEGTLGDLDYAAQLVRSAFYEWRAKQGSRGVVVRLCSAALALVLPRPNLWSVLTDTSAIPVDSTRARTLDAIQQAILLRDIFGNPFRPVAFSAAWRTDTVLSLARQMCESREFGVMPILADAIQDAGCDSDALLNHLRDTGATHVRGCWALDLVLGKE